MTASTTGTGIRVTSAMRLFMFAAAALVSLAAIPLFFFSEKTEEYFAWTIQPPLTAAFLGAGYWAVTATVVLALREREWTRVRISLPVVGAGLILILAATLLHLDRFHTNSPIFTAQLEAWLWLILYVGLIPGLFWAYVQQRREPGIELPRTAPLPVWLRGLMGVLGVVMIIFGIGLFILPTQFAAFWGWTLTPLTARMAGSWFCAIAVSLLVGVRENDYSRVYISALAYVVYAVLQGINLARYPDVVQWNQPYIWLFIGLMVTLLVIGIALLRGYLSRRASPIIRAP